MLILRPTWDELNAPGQGRDGVMWLCAQRWRE
jgi:hypothetical protein